MLNNVNILNLEKVEQIVKELKEERTNYKPMNNIELLNSLEQVNDSEVMNKLRIINCYKLMDYLGLEGYKVLVSYIAKEIIEIIYGNRGLENPETIRLIITLEKLIKAFDGNIDVKIKNQLEKIVYMLESVLEANLDVVRWDRTRVKDTLICYAENLKMSEKLEEAGINNAICLERLDELLEKTEEFYKLDIKLTEGEIIKLGYLFEGIEESLKSLEAEIDNAKTDEEKLKVFAMSDLFLELLDNRFEKQMKNWETKMLTERLREETMNKKIIEYQNKAVIKSRINYLNLN